MKKLRTVENCQKSNFCLQFTVLFCCCNANSVCQTPMHLFILEEDETVSFIFDDFSLHGVNSKCESHTVNINMCTLCNLTGKQYPLLGGLFRFTYIVYIEQIHIRSSAAQRTACINLQLRLTRKVSLIHTTASVSVFLLLFLFTDFFFCRRHRHYRSDSVTNQRRILHT